MAAPSVWMQVISGAYNTADDERITAKYYDSIDKVVVDVGSGSLFMTLAKALELVAELAPAITAAGGPAPAVRPVGARQRRRARKGVASQQDSVVA